MVKGLTRMTLLQSLEAGMADGRSSAGGRPGAEVALAEMPARVEDRGRERPPSAGLATQFGRSTGVARTRSTQGPVCSGHFRGLVHDQAKDASTGRSRHCPGASSPESLPLPLSLELTPKLVA